MRAHVSDPDNKGRVARHECPTSGIGLAFTRGQRLRLGGANGEPSQTLVEFAFILPVFLLLMLGVIQVIIIGSAALAVSQAAVTCARYASLNPSYTASQVNSYLQSSASPLINNTGLGEIELSPTSVPRQTGTAVSVTVTYNLASKLFLGSSFFGVTFPTEVSVTQTMTSE
jgi:Flp pilus assembly protein TadG